MIIITKVLLVCYSVLLVVLRKLLPSHVKTECVTLDMSRSLGCMCGLILSTIYNLIIIAR